jgi:hypothetical protein
LGGLSGSLGGGGGGLGRLNRGAGGVEALFERGDFRLQGGGLLVRALKNTI